MSPTDATCPLARVATSLLSCDTIDSADTVLLVDPIEAVCNLDDLGPEAQGANLLEFKAGASNLSLGGRVSKTHCSNVFLRATP